MICFMLNLIFNFAQAVDISIGKPAPAFSLPSTNGKKVSLNQYKDSVVILIYWRSNQRRSLMALKDGQDILDQFEDKGVQVIGLMADTSHSDTVRDSLKKNNIDFTMLLDSERQVFGDYGIYVYPSTVLIDKQGKVAYTLAGHALTYKKTLEGHIQYILGEIDEKTLHQGVSRLNEISGKSLVKAHSEYNLALRFIESHLLNLAKDAAKRAIKAKADIAEPHILLGFLYLEDNEADMAYNEFEVSLKLDPYSHDAKTGLGASLITKGMISRAIEVLGGAVSENPYPEMTFYELGRAYELQGDISKSIEMYKKAIDKNLHNKATLSYLSRCR